MFYLLHCENLISGLALILNNFHVSVRGFDYSMSISDMQKQVKLNL